MIIFDQIRLLLHLTKKILVTGAHGICTYVIARITLLAKAIRIYTANEIFYLGS